ncbi:MAG: alpha-galactosidase, partial [Planctomycetota bacterium]|nr:alpha-galactosidase [Planctomycetota bacterium]
MGPIRLLSGILVVAVCCPLLLAEAQSIRSAALEVTYDPPAGRFSVSAAAGARPFIADGKLSGAGGAARVAAVRDKTFGDGQAIEIAYPGGNRDQILLFPDLPFVLFRAGLHNGGREASVTDKVRPFSASLDLGVPADALRVLGTGGLAAPDQKTGSYMWLAVAEPRSRRGVVAGWITVDRGSGIVFAAAEDGRVRLDAQIDYGRLRLAPGRTETLETFALGCFDDARLGLEAWADVVARVYAIKLPPQPVGYCTWYHAGALSEQKLPEQATFAAKNLKPFGFSFVQIDDGWQDGDSQKNGPRKNFTRHRAGGPYPSGMTAAADGLRVKGLVPGIWFMPFAGTYYDPFFKEHQDWFVKRENGEPFETAWGGTCLDMTHPGARAYLKDNIQRIGHEWG